MKEFINEFRACLNIRGIARRIDCRHPQFPKWLDGEKYRTLQDQEQQSLTELLREMKEKLNKIEGL